MIFGYARVSKKDQNLDRQLDMLEAYGVDKIFKEKLTGKKANRPELNRMIEQLREGDAVVVESLTRLGRSLRDLLKIVGKFDSMGVNFVSLKENIDTTTPTGKLTFHIFASIAQFEREIISERTKQGLESARIRGRLGGRPRKDKMKVDIAISLYDSKKYTVKEIYRETGVSPATLYRYLDERKKAY